MIRRQPDADLRRCLGHRSRNRDTFQGRCTGHRSVGPDVGGGVIDKAAGATATGVIISPAVGGAAGAIIGAEMNKQARELKQNIPGATVARVGKGISERRAASAANHLVAQGVRRNGGATRGMGESEPAATNDTEAGRQQNRRVAVAIYASEAYRAEVAKRAQQ